MGNSAKFVGVGANPDGLVWSAAEIVVFEILASLGVNDVVGISAVGAGAEQITRGSQVVGVRWNDMCVGPDWKLVRRGFGRGGGEMWQRHPRS